MRVSPGATCAAGLVTTLPSTSTLPYRIGSYACEREARPSFDKARTSATFLAPAFALRCPSLRRGKPSTRPTPSTPRPLVPRRLPRTRCTHYGLMIFIPVGVGGATRGAVMWLSCRPND